MSAFTAEQKFVAGAMSRESLYYYSRYMFLRRKNFNWLKNPHHKIVCDALTDVFEGRTKRLIINVPPRYSKTELAVVNFITWCLGKVPDAEFIHTSYSTRLAVNNSWQARELLTTEAYQEIFPTRLHADSKSKDEWRTSAGGVMYATGAGGTITGYGAGKQREGFGGAIIIDDPHKPDEASSDTIREGVLEWFQNTLESRKNSKDTPIVLIMQRLHERDLSGWLLDGGNGEHWDHVCLPARQDDGSPLWPEKHSAEDLERMERANAYVFAGQYMQTPSPAEGGIIKPENIEIVDALPSRLTIVRGWDLAATKNAGDWTAGGKLGMDNEGGFWIADMQRMRGSPEDVEKALVNTAKMDGPGVRISIPQDPGQAGKSQAAYLGKKLFGSNFVFSTETGDKATRAAPFASQVNIGNVKMLRAPWNDALIAEMRMFPNGANDDQVDALSRAFNELQLNNLNRFMALT